MLIPTNRTIPLPASLLFKPVKFISCAPIESSAQQPLQFVLHLRIVLGCSSRRSMLSGKFSRRLDERLGLNLLKLVWDRTSGVEEDSCGGNTNWGWKGL